MSRLEKIWLFLAWTLSLTGCFLQMVYIVSSYFEYQTVTKLQLVRPLNITAPQLVVCVDPAAFEPSTRENGSLTAAQILSDAKAGKDIVDKCTIHSKVMYGKSKRCDISADFETKKFLKHGKLCYSFKLKDSEPFLSRYLYNGFNGPYIWKLELKSKVKWNTKLITEAVYLHPHKLHFYGDSNTFVENIVEHVEGSNGSFSNYFMGISYQRFEVNRMPPPYDTRCHDYKEDGFESQDACFATCYEGRIVSKLSKVPTSVMVEKLHDFALLTEEDYQNSSTLAAIKDISEICTANCAQNDCEYVTIVPKIIASADATEPTIVLYASNEPEIRSTAVAKIPFIEFLTQVLSCFGFWIALSPLTVMQSLHIRKVLKFFGHRRGSVSPVRGQVDRVLFQRRTAAESIRDAAYHELQRQVMSDIERSLRRRARVW